MEFSSILTFMAVAALLVVSPGPNGLLIAKTVPLNGYRAGLANVFGFVTAFYIHGTLSVFGLAIILVQSGQAFFVFKMLGAIYLMWLGIKALKNAIIQPSETPADTNQPVSSSSSSSLRRAFAEGLLTNLLNPKVSVFYLAAFPQFLSGGDSALEAYTLISAHAFLNIVWFSAMVFAFTKVTNVAISPRLKTWFHSLTGAIFIGFGAKLALTKSSL